MEQCLPRCEGCGFLERCFNCPRRAQDRDCGCQFALLHRADNESQHNEDGVSSHYSYAGSRHHSSRRYRKQPSIIEQPVDEQPDDDNDDDDDDDDVDCVVNNETQYQHHIVPVYNSDNDHFQCPQLASFSHECEANEQQHCKQTMMKMDEPRNQNNLHEASVSGSGKPEKITNEINT